MTQPATMASGCPDDEPPATSSSSDLKRPWRRITRNQKYEKDSGRNLLFEVFYKNGYSIRHAPPLSPRFNSKVKKKLDLMAYGKIGKRITH